jgi:AmpE protein
MLDTAPMSFLILLATLVAERFLLPYQHLRRADWFARWLEFQQSLPVGQGLREGPGGLVFLLLPPLLLVLAVQVLLGSLLGDIVGLLIATAILLYCLGPDDLDTQVQALTRAAEQGEHAEAQAIAAALPDIGGGEANGADYPIAANLLGAAQRRIFGTLLWFLVLGPTGALLYRLSRETAQLAVTQARPGLEPGGRGLLYLLDWIPARMLSGLFALAGNFETAVRAWHQCERDDRDGLELTRCSGLGALQLDTSLTRVETAPPDTRMITSAMSLVWRSLVILLALLGLATVAAWLA